MSIPDRTFLRAAVRIQDALAHPKDQDRPIELPAHTWDRVQRSFVLWSHAESCTWHQAATVREEELHRHLNELIGQLYLLQANVKRQTEPVSVPSLRSILEDLRFLGEEFPEVEVDLRHAEITAITEPIILDSIELGRFAIILDWSASGRPHPYRIVAQEPNPASSNDEVIHPHVTSDYLCEGEAEGAIRTALEQGRLFDFFLLVRQVLMTYNSASAYVRLENWSGISCGDCGSLTEDSDYCTSCESTLCPECSIGCLDCGDRYCLGCLGPCCGCADLYCPSCLRPCEGCSQHFCSGCLDENHNCPECQLSEAEEETEAAPLHADGLGEAPVPS